MIVFNSLKQIKAISFDLDDTLYDNVPIIEKAEAWYQQMLAEHPFFVGKELPSHEQLKQKLWKANHAIIDDVTKCRRRILYLRFLSAGLESEDAEINAELMLQKFIEIRSELMVPDESIKLLKHLKKKYPLVAITNGNVDIEKIKSNIKKIYCFIIFFHFHLGYPCIKLCQFIFFIIFSTF